MRKKSGQFVKTIAVIGHLVRDRIVKPDGNTTEAPGGIAYSLSALGVLAGESIKVRPVCNVGCDYYEAAKAAFECFPAIDFSAVRKIGRKNKIHELTYRKNGYRRELNIGKLPEIRPLLFENIPRIDAAWLNYIGGDEFPPSSIKWLKRKYKPLIYLDYHSLSLGRKVISKKGKKVERYFRRNPHWREYVELADIVQMNDIELQSIFPGPDLSTESIIKSAVKVTEAGPKAVIITREDRALVVVEKRGRELVIHLLEVPPVRVVDPTGCGDCLGAGFIAGYLRHRDVYRACIEGLKLANKKAEFSGLDGFIK